MFDFFCCFLRVGLVISSPVVQGMLRRKRRRGVDERQFHLFDKYLRPSRDFGCGPNARVCEPQSPRIYIASRTVHAEKWRRLREDGFPIVSTWIDEAGAGQSQCLSNLA